MTRPRLVIWLCAAVFYGALAGAVMAQPVCDLQDQQAFPRIDRDTFFALPKGTLALGGVCDEGDNLCTTYIDINACSQVLYPLAASGQANTLFVALNSVSTCSEDCDLADSFLAASLLYDPADTPKPVAPFAHLIRNASSRWFIYHRAVPARESCCYGAVPPPLFVDAQSATRQVAEFFALTKKYWHSAFAGVGDRTVETWTFRAFAVDALQQCGADCSIKAYLLRFQERAAIDGKRPAAPLLLSGNLMSFNAVHLQTMVPSGGEAYTHDVMISLVR